MKPRVYIESFFSYEERGLRPDTCYILEHGFGLRSVITQMYVSAKLAHSLCLVTIRFSGYFSLNH